LATTGFLLRPHEQMSYVWPVSKFFGNTVWYHRHRSWDLFNYCTVHTLYLRLVLLCRQFSL
jgi:hypothetical protein